MPANYKTMDMTGGGNIPIIDSDEAREKLAPGTQYYDPQGRLRTRGANTKLGPGQSR